MTGMPRRRRSSGRWRWPSALLAVGVMLALAACRRGPRAIALGSDTCARCLMQITDARYAAEYVTHTGKVYTFDSIECLAAEYLSLTPAARDGVESVWVSDYAHPGTLIPVSRAWFARVRGPGSPMGRGMLAVADSAAPAVPHAARETAWMDWDALRALAERERWTEVEPGAAPGHSHAAGAPSHASGGAGPSDMPSIAAAIRAAHPGDTVRVPAGTYREPTFVVDKPITLLGLGLPTLDGEGQRQIMTITADDVTVRGFRFTRVGTSYVEDRAAIKVVGARRCTLAENAVEDAFFGIYLAGAADCLVRGNRIAGRAEREAASGNGIHLWNASHIRIVDNTITGHRDGIYLEFSHHADVRGNRAEHNLRYGLHFMYSDSSAYQGNEFRANGAGVAVMYARDITMSGNRFEDNWGPAAYGLLLKEIVDSRVAGNVLRRNTTGLLIDGANRLVADSNQFVENGWALKLDGGTQDARFSANEFRGNTFDAAAAGRVLSTTVDGNYWDAYRGYDLDHDGIGDVPYHPVRLFSVIVARNDVALLLLRSVFAQVVDAGERAIPALTPPAFADAHPRMRPRS
jgi:nitrous oxidase accessory protein